MFQREALWMSLGRADQVRQSRSLSEVCGHLSHLSHSHCSLGVNAITGKSSQTATPPTCEQDYVVAALQPWLDGIMTEAGIVRQVYSFLFPLPFAHLI